MNIKEQHIKAVIIKHLELWSNVSSHHIHIQRMSSITNETYRASPDPLLHPNIPPVIYRQLGEATNNIFLDRQAEVHIYLHISNKGKGPAIHYYDSALRIEEYIESHTLSPQHVLTSPYLEEVAFALREFHQLQPLSEYIPRLPFFRRVFLENRGNVLQKIHQKLKKEVCTEEEKKVICGLKEWASEKQLQFIERVTERLDKEKLAFCHNDLHPSNILVKHHAQRILLIDYEYASFNYSVYDIAYYLTKPQFSYHLQQIHYQAQTSLNQERENRFIEAYVIAKYLPLEQFRKEFESERTKQQYQKEIEHLKNLLPLGKMLCQLVLGWWMILSSDGPSITLQHLAYANRRHLEYEKYKRVVVELMSEDNP